MTPTSTPMDASGNEEALSPHIRFQVDLLGRLLGEVIQEQAGEEIFSLVEDLRLRCQSAAAAADPSGYDAVRERIGRIDLASRPVPWPMVWRPHGANSLPSLTPTLCRRPTF